MNTATMADITDVLPNDEASAKSLAVHQSQSPAVQQRAVSMTPGELLRYALDSGATIDTLEKLLELQQKYEANEARKAFVEGMAAFKREPLEIFKRKEVGYKTKEGDFVGYKHAELSDVCDAIAPAMAKHGLSFDWDIRQAPNLITVDCVITHVKGHSKTVTMSGPPDASGKKNVIQQVASTVTYLERYTLLAATGMSTKDEDNDGAGGAEPQEGQQQGQQQQAQPARPAAPKEFYSQQKFDLNKADWRETIKSKRKTPEALIKLIEGKGNVPLTDDQKLTIDSWSHEND